MAGGVSMVDGHIDEPRKQTNYDRIRNMSVEELADFLLDIHCNAWLCGVNDDSDYVFKYNKKWLESEVDTE